MRTAFLVLLLGAAADVIACGLLLGVVWVAHRRVRREAAAAGENVPSAAGQFRCLIAMGLIGLTAIYGAVWWLVK